MKLSKFLIIFLVAAVACSKKEDSAPSLQNAKVTTTTVQVPSGLTTAANTNTHAQEVVSYITIANGMTDYTSLFAVPTSGATKSSTVITASNGRVAAVTSTTETYIWSDPQYGSVAFQITDEGTSYRWEYFYKATGAKDWLKYLNAEEAKDGSSGHLEVLDFTGDDPKAVYFQFNWSKVKDQFTFRWTFADSYFILNMNTTTKVGSVDYYESDGTTGSIPVVVYKYSWNADGHGSWQSFDWDGVQSGSGTW
ncbi:MAG TPA: hypothetical protein VGQ59_16270 [Cyclobacteriaceae bacterium]|jgi:hypothetical protein|nr:hypothetical protein [Cyclobacteriaceae bacterium]